MGKFNFIKITKRKKIRYISTNNQAELIVVFLHGFMSDLEGSKPEALRKYCTKKKLGFIALEYSGHGKSSGKFIDGNITKWTRDAKYVIEKKIRKKKFILVGSSMGAWISINLFKYFKKQIKGFLGIGSAPEFLDRLMWNKFTKKMKKETINNGLYNLKHGNYLYPLSYQLIKDGKKNKVFNKKINSQIPITMLHGEKDEVVPLIFSKKILKMFINSKKKLKVIMKGDHSLSSLKNIKIILSELDNLIKSI